MPRDMMPAIERTPAGYRVFTWKFSDGSQMIFAFVPKGGEGSEQGLILNYVDLKD